MGNCFSDPSSQPSHKHGQGQKLGSAPASRPTPQQQQLSTRGKTNNDPPRTLGGSIGGSPGAEVGGGDPRERALKAAEERAKASQSKGVNASNPKAGQLSAKLAAENRSKASTQNNDQRMMDRGEWN
ncbi:hypothetical protein I302_107359 [Kwoniella bestiolae CBS 10118]|uniref:Uncharacterized protein n=1 Tax=Kwoniella bestiolae CBS 10118 TaxID=1296100 RepID=A0A1B9FYR2_9TREE|nr:hypothetical protein I302_06903 [Kwoniella bestiolae CBS 10118]OCF23917.1 hypothetical protein I302_06903 [Kwoniella bestiolae CBS 10118]